MILNADNVLNFMPSGIGEFGGKAQVGIDLSIKNINKIVGGKVYQNGKKDIDPYQEVEHYLEQKDKDSEEMIKTYILKQGEVYSITFDQTVKLDDCHIARVVNKSTLLRCGCICTSGIYDPGFESSEEGCGATLFCFGKNVEIQTGAKIAQLLIAECEKSESYKLRGNYQGNKDLL